MPSNLKTIHDSNLLVFDKLSCINNNDLDYVNTDRKVVTNNGENNMANIDGNSNNSNDNNSDNNNNNSSNNYNNDNNQHCKDNISSIINSDIKTSYEITLLNNQNNNYQQAKETKIKSDYLEINNQYKNENENKNEIEARSSSDFSKFNLLSSNSNSNEFLNSGNSYFFQPEKSIFQNLRIHLNLNLKIIN